MAAMTTHMILAMAASSFVSATLHQTGFEDAEDTCRQQCSFIALLLASAVYMLLSLGWEVLGSVFTM
jgi:hypothetical protein